MPHYCCCKRTWDYPLCLLQVTSAHLQRCKGCRDSLIRPQRTTEGGKSSPSWQRNNKLPQQEPISPLQGTSDLFQSPPWANSNTQQVHQEMDECGESVYLSVRVGVWQVVTKIDVLFPAQRNVRPTLFNFNGIYGQDHPHLGTTHVSVQLFVCTHTSSLCHLGSGSHVLPVQVKHLM